MIIEGSKVDTEKKVIYLRFALVPIPCWSFFLKILFQKVELQEAEQLYKEYLNSISEIIKNIEEIN